MIKENERLFVTLLKCADIGAGLLSILLAYGLRFFVFHGVSAGVVLGDYLRMLAVAAPVYFLLYHGFELYDMFHYKPILVETEKVVYVNFLGAAFLFLLSFFLRLVDVSRLLIIFFFVINTLLSALMRMGIRLLLRSLRRQGRTLNRLLIVGWNDVSGEFYDKLMSNRNFGYDVVGCLSDRRPATGGRDVPYLGRLADLEELLQSGEVDEVVISLEYDEFRRLGSVIEVCEREGVKSSLLPFYAQYLPAHPYVDELDGMPLINLHRIPLDNLFNRFLKRGFDIVGALALVLVLSPLMLATAVCIRLSSPGPVIYRQERIGRNKKVFTMYKFRSMRTDAGADMTTWGTKNDRRRTKFGAFIRKVSIDELPQLFNVLRGDMSLVGPRPERPFFVEKFRDEVPLYMLKHLVRPGISGWAQVNGWRGDTSIVERVKCDLFYIENWSFLLDIKILWLTLVRGVVNQSEEL